MGSAAAADAAVAAARRTELVREQQRQYQRDAAAVRMQARHRGKASRSNSNAFLLGKASGAGGGKGVDKGGFDGGSELRDALLADATSLPARFGWADADESEVDGGMDDADDEARAPSRSTAIAGGPNPSSVTDKDGSKPMLRRTPVKRKPRGKHTPLGQEPAAAPEALGPVATAMATYAPAATAGPAEEPVSAADKERWLEWAKVAEEWLSRDLSPPVSRFSSSNWRMADMRKGDPFWEGGAPSPLEPRALRQIASKGRLSTSPILQPAWQFPEGEVELSDEEAAEVHARITRQPRSPVRYTTRADTALERSRARARDAKARLLSSELPLTDGLWRFDPVSTLHADPAVLYRLQEKDYSTAVWES